MKVDIFHYTNQGTRPINEDSFDVSVKDGNYTVAVCDGLGGHECGEVASGTAVKNIISGIDSLEEVSAESIQNVMSRINDFLIKKQQENPNVNGMRTTAVACILRDNNLWYFNTGDSRIYIFRNGYLNSMSKDHSISMTNVDMGEMRFRDIRTDPDRNKLYKVLGQEINGEVSTVYNTINLQPGDAFLLCSDGFWEYVLEEEMEVDLSKAGSAEDWADFMLVRLLNRVHGDYDNYTVVCGIVTELDKEV